jgi:hypothetical protein
MPFSRIAYDIISLLMYGTEKLTLASSSGAKMRLLSSISTDRTGKKSMEPRRLSSPVLSVAMSQ